MLYQFGAKYTKCWVSRWETRKKVESVCVQLDKIWVSLWATRQNIESVRAQLGKILSKSVAN